MTKPKTDSFKKKPIMLVTLGVVSLIVTAFAANFILQGMKEAKIKEQEKQTAIQTEQKRQAAIQEEKERQTAEENEPERLANLKTEVEAEEQEPLAALEAEQEAALKAALAAPRPWQLKVSIKSKSSDLENVIRGEQ
jgi:DUF4097 and DUF4098 domain-containing protein YvlB